jgi:hypothetical protein
MSVFLVLDVSIFSFVCAVHNQNNEKQFNNLIESGYAKKISLKTSKPSSLLLFQLTYFASSNHCSQCCIYVLGPLSSFYILLLFLYMFGINIKTLDYVLSKIKHVSWCYMTLCQIFNTFDAVVVELSKES